MMLRQIAAMCVISDHKNYPYSSVQNYAGPAGGRESALFYTNSFEPQSNLKMDFITSAIRNW